MTGLTGDSNLIASSIQYVINVFMTIFALIFIDRWGRRVPLLVGATLMATFMFANAGLFASYGHPALPGGLQGVPEESWVISGHAGQAVIARTYLFVASTHRRGAPCRGSTHPNSSRYAFVVRQLRSARPQTGSSISPCRTLCLRRSSTSSGRRISSSASSARPWRSMSSSCSRK